MTEIPKDPLRVFEDLEKELLQAMHLDKVHKLQNEAKFRAVHQNVQSYEEFKEIVNAAHLQPLKKGDLQELRTPKPAKWNCLVSPKSSTWPERVFVGGVDFQNATLPQTYQECLKLWQKGKLADSERLQILKNVQAEWLSGIIMLETSSCSIGNVLKALVCFEDSQDDVQFVVRVLVAISEMPRFDLAVDFLTEEEKEMGRQLFGILRPRWSGKESSEITWDELDNKYAKMYG